MRTFRKSGNLPFYHRAYQQFSKIAAIVFLPLLLLTGWYFLRNRQLITEGRIYLTTSVNNNYSEIYSPFGARTRFVLSDGTVGWLNSDSHLKVPIKFDDSQRKVELSGEGFFDVKKNPEIPFVVSIYDREIMALGTKFNIISYPDDETFEITLESGEVIIKNKRKFNKPQELTELHPGQQMIITKKTDQIEIKEVDTRNYTSWIDGKLVFRNDPMSEVVKKIGRWYNVEVSLKDKALLDYRYRATFEDETLNEVLKLLKLTSPIDYIEQSREILPDGSFAKKEIVLFLKTENK